MFSSTWLPRHMNLQLGLGVLVITGHASELVAQYGAMQGSLKQRDHHQQDGLIGFQDAPAACSAALLGICRFGPLV